MSLPTPNGIPNSWLKLNELFSEGNICRGTRIFYDKIVSTRFTEMEIFSSEKLLYWKKKK